MNVATSPTHLESLLAAVYDQEPDACEEITRSLLPGVRLIVRKRVNLQDVEDIVQETMADILAGLKKRTLHHADALPGFARTVAIRKCAACIKATVTTRLRFSDSVDDIDTAPSSHMNPEESAMTSQKMRAAHVVLSQLSVRDREILRRFYLEEQSQEQICSAMALSPTQFRVLKCRAKARFAHIGRCVDRRGIRTNHGRQSTVRELRVSLDGSRTAMGT